MSEKTTLSVSVDAGLKTWADENHGRLGYRSRSALVNDLLHRCRQTATDDTPDRLLGAGTPTGDAPTDNHTADTEDTDA